MRRIATLFLFAVLFVAGCDSGGPDPDPEPQVDPPTAGFSADPTTVEVGGEVSFTADSENATSWEWDFGDGSTSSSENPTHAYEEEGSYTVSLTVSNDAGAEDTETKEDYITVDPEPTPPEADFEADQTTAEVADTVQFTDNSTNDPTSWEWDFGDGETSEEQNPILVYEEPGNYDVSLTATNDDGSDTETKLGYITVEAQRTFFVKYEVDATFPECDVRYDNESGGSTSRTINFDDRDDPWTLSFDITVRGEFSSEYAGMYVSCYEFDANETASAKLYIDGEVFEEGEETGESVSIDLDARLTLEGAEPF